jgi:hypothetical protein
MNVRRVNCNYRAISLRHTQLRSFVRSNSVELVSVRNLSESFIDAISIQGGESAIKTKAEVLWRFQAHLAEERSGFLWNVKQLNFTHIEWDFLGTIFGHGLIPFRASLNASMPVARDAASPYSNAQLTLAFGKVSCMKSLQKPPGA